MVKELNLLTLKPLIYVLNTDELGISEKKEKIALSFSPLRICAALEAELAGFSPQERKEFLEEAWIKEPGLPKLIREAYHLLGLLTFYTIKGGKEVHAWPIKRGTMAVEAASVVHSDMTRGFIKAEVIKVQDLLSLGGWQKARETGKLTLVGRDYQLNDGDVVEFKFNV